MKRNSFLVVLLLFALAFLFVGCKKEEEPEPNPILVVGTIELQTEEGKTVKINAAIANVEDDEEEYELEFSSSDPTIAEVDANGNVDAKKAGEATITVSIKDFEDQKTEVKVIVLAKPTPPGKEIIEEFIPESIDIMGFVSMEVGASEQFMAMVKPASAYQVLVWSTSDPSIATVDNEGNVTAHSFGTVTITAHSAIAPDVKDSFEVVVKETGEDHEIAKKAFDYILERIPKYVTESFDLPVYPNPDVTITWKDASGTVLADNRYVYNEDITEDTTDAVICLIEYGFATREESVALKVVADPEKNNFANIELISLYLDILFADYIADSVNGDLPLPTALKGATLVWSTTKSDVITKTGEFTKPNNDTPVRLTALVTSGPIAQTFNFDLVAKGYTQQEKVDYSLTEGVLKPLVGLSSNANITLPSFEPRFGLTITWKSANEDVFDSNGVYRDRDLKEDTEVTFIAKFKEGDTVFDVTAEVTVTALAATDVSKAVYDFVRNNAILAAIPTYFPFGLRESGNEIVGLPTSMEDHDGVTIEWEGNPEDFDGLVLKTQYLRYHETYLTATFSKEGVEPSTLKFLLNTGIAERDDSVNIGGRFSEQKVKDGVIEWDLLNTFSYWDLPVGEVTYKTQQYWSYYSGYTWYIDAETDRTSTLEQVEPGEGKRYQYFAMDFVTVYIMDVDADGKVTDWEYGNLREKTGGNWGVFFVNLSGKAAKIPLATHGAGKGTDGEPWVSQGSRENALTFDGYRKGFVANADGTVIMGSGFGVVQDVLPSTTRHIDIPANGYGMTFKTQENLPIVGVFCHEGTKLTIQRFDLAPENDYRAIRFKSNLNNAETGIIALEKGEETEINVDAAIKNAATYLYNPRLTEFELSMFNKEKYKNIIARSAALWEADFEAMREKVDEEGYLLELLPFYEKFQAIHDDVKALIGEELVNWLKNEYDSKLLSCDITLHLNGGQYYAETRQEVADMFLADLYEHLTNVKMLDLPETLEEFKAGIESSFTAEFVTTYLYEFIKDNPNALTVDESGEAKQFFRQEEYNEKWLPLLLMLNDAVQIGHGGGRDILGRTGEKYKFHYIIPAEGSKLFDVTVSAQDGFNTRIREYLLGTFAYAAYKEYILEDQWLLSPGASQEKANALGLQYSGGQATIEIPAVYKEGYVLEGWYLDEELTQPAVLTPVGLGRVDVDLYAKWIVPPGELLGDFTITEFNGNIYGQPENNVYLDPDETGGTYWLKILLVATEDEGVFEVTGYVNTGSLEFGESDYSIHVHDSNPDAYNHIKSLEIAVGDLITFSTDITKLEDGSVNVVAKVWRPAE
jgi:hypothetical protein